MQGATTGLRNAALAWHVDRPLIGMSNVDQAGEPY